MVPARRFPPSCRHPRTVVPAPPANHCRRGPRTAIVEAVASSRDRVRFRVLLLPYALGLVVWLVLGILPTLIADVPDLHQQLLLWAGHDGFSLLNLALGILLVVRRADERVPRLLTFALLAAAATFNMPSHRAFSITGAPWPIEVIDFSFPIVSGVTYLWAVVLFPSGRLPRRTQLAGPALWALVAGPTALMAFIGWRGGLVAHPQFFVVLFGILVPAAGLASQGLRLTDPQTAGDERRVARLLVAALLPALGAGAAWLAGVLAGGQWSPAAPFAARVATWFPAAFALVPVVLFTCHLRYRSWDVDRGLVAIEPLRARAQRWADRVVYGQDQSPMRALRSLVGGLERLGAAGEIDQLTEVAVRATRASAAALWLLDGADWTIASVYPSGAVAPGREGSWPVSYRGDLLGAVSARGDLAATDAALLSDLSGHAGLVVHNALLTVQLARQVAVLSDRTAELRQVRRRLVEAADSERRRLERNLHDGAQQQLVATIAFIAALATTGAGEPELARHRAELRRMLTDARASVLQLCGDGRPPILEELGLPAALHHSVGLACASGVRTAIQISAVELPAEVEAAAYFCCCEALTNVAKYAGARTATVSLQMAGPDLELTVVDDGRGFDPSAAVGAGGLSALTDRLAPVGGRLCVRSAAGLGTTLRADIPVPA